MIGLVRWFVVASIAVGACAVRGQPIAEAPSRPTAPRLDAISRGEPVEFTPIGEPAARYNDPPSPSPHSALGDAVVAAVGDAAMSAGLPVPLPDARLSRACADLAEVMPEDRIAGVRFDNSVVEFALQRNGIIEPEVRLLFAWGDVAAPEHFVRELQPRLAETVREGTSTRLGVGVGRRKPDGTGAIVVALQGSAVSTRPIPRAVGPHGDIVVDAVIDPRFHDPEVFVTSAHGDTEEIDLASGRPGGFVARIACGARPGRRQIEITASDASGAAVLANFPVWCAAEPPPSLVVEPLPDEPPVDDPEQAEAQLLASINRDRGAADLPSLRWDDAVAAVARRHAEEMRRTRVVAHVSSTTGSAADRVRAAGIATRVVLENVARAYSLHEAHRALMNSPGHRANILSAEVTHVGIGVALGDDGTGRRALFITEVFTRLPPGFADARRADPPARGAAVAVAPMWRR
jgi:uncharacterized protein YkwD